MIAAGGATVAVACCMLAAPRNRTVQTFASGFFSPQIARRLQAAATPADRNYFAGLLSGYIALTVGAGIGILKKRTFGVALLLLNGFRALAALNLAGAIFTLGSSLYYFRRREEFHFP